MCAQKDFEMKKLYGYQQAALDWATTQNRVAFFLEMRLGKTILAIRWAEQKALQKILVVCPLSVVWTWQDELFSEGLSSIQLTGTQKEKKELLEEQSSRWYIINYEGIYTRWNGRSIPSLISRCGWDCVILDESTYIRNPKAIRTKMCKKQFMSIPYKAVLSGLPNPESSLDFYEQMAFINGTFLNCKNYWEFRLRYFHQGWNQWDWIPNRNTITQIKEKVRENAFVLSRKQARIGSRKIFETRFVELPPKVRTAYNGLEKNFELGGDKTKWILVVKTWLSRLAGGFPNEEEYQSNHKTRELLLLMQSELRNEQVIIWFRFNKEMYATYEMLFANNFKCDFIDGEVSIEKRNKIQKNFLAGKIQCLLIQIKCGKFGLDFSAASTAIYMSNSWEFEERNQSEDRILSPQKKEPVLILDLITKNSVDEDVHRALKQKGMNSKIFVSAVLENMKKRLGKVKFH